MQIRIDDEEIQVGLTPEEFQKRLSELLSESEMQSVHPICDRIVLWRGDVPDPPKLFIERLWWIGSVLAGAIFLYGLYSIGVKVAGLL